MGTISRPGAFKRVGTRVNMEEVNKVYYEDELTNR
jgi:hypothetical protein